MTTHSLRQAMANRDAGIDQVDRGASEEWKAKALSVVRELCFQKETFTADDVWEYGLASPREARALGAVMRRAKKLGYCEPTTEFTSSRQPQCHATANLEKQLTMTVERPPLRPVAARDARARPSDFPLHIQVLGVLFFLLAASLIFLLLWNWGVTAKTGLPSLDFRTSFSFMLIFYLFLTLKKVIYP